MRRSHAQEALNRTEYAEGTDILDHIKLLRTRKAAVDNLSSSTMSDETWRGIIIRSIPPTANWLPVIPSLYTMTTSADIVSTLSAHGMILARYTSSTTTAVTTLGTNYYSNTALAAQTTSSDLEGCTNPNCKAKIRSTHTTANCYWPGGGKEGQFPPDFGMRSRANVTTLTSNPERNEHFALSAQVWNTNTCNTTGHSGILISTMTPAHYYSSDPTTSTTNRQHNSDNTIDLPTANPFSLAKTQLEVRKTDGHSDTTVTMTNHVPQSATLSRSFRKATMLTAGSDSLSRRFTTGKYKSTVYPCLTTPHTGTVSKPLANHFTEPGPDLDNAINDGHHIKLNNELDITDISDAPLAAAPRQYTSASVGEQLHTPLTAVTELEPTNITTSTHGTPSRPLTPFTLTTSLTASVMITKLEPIILPPHRPQFTNTTTLGNTLTTGTLTVARSPPRNTSPDIVYTVTDPGPGSTSTINNHHWHINRRCRDIQAN